VIYHLRSISTDSSCQLNILRHDGDSLCVNGTEVSIFEQSNQVRLGSFLKGENSVALESQVRFVVLGNFSDKSLERSFSDQKISGLLILSDFSESDGSRFESVLLLHSSACRSGRFFGCLAGQLFAGSFSTSRLSCCLLSSCHYRN